jgi:hypothetical protein
LPKKENESYFSKMIKHTHPFWRLKYFNHHLMVGCVQWQSKNLVAIRKTATIQWQLNIFGCHERGACHIFWKALIKGFLKTYHTPPSMATKKFQLRQKKVAINLWLPQLW